jgi:Family of unknown function (DUF5317)
MTLLVSILAISVLTALLAGRGFRGFPDEPIRWGWVALAGLSVQFVPIHGARAWLVLVGSFAVLLAFVAANVRVPGFFLLLVGIALNLVVITVNQGMPVTRAALDTSDQVSTIDELRDGVSAKHHLADADTLLTPLSDAIGIPRPIGQAVSVGDLCMYAGVAWYVVASMRPRRRAVARWAA